jgi:tRNA 2-thiouridine synthesizing protein C
MSEQQATQTSGPKVKKFMFVNRKAPYGTIYALESLEVVLITATFDQDVSLVFIDDGVYDQASLDLRGLTEADLLVPVEVLNAQQMGQLMAQQDVILSF